MAMRKKKIILDGDVMDEDDPRYLEHLARQRASPSNHASRAPQQPMRAPPANTASRAVQPAAPGHRPAGLDFSAPPLRILPTEAGASMLSTEVEIFGMRLPALALIALVFVGMQFGLRALAGGAILLYFYQANRPAAGPRPTQGAGGPSRGPAPGPAGAQAGTGGGMDFGSIMSSLGLGNSGTGAGAGGQAGGGQAGSGPAGGGQAAGQAPSIQAGAAGGGGGPFVGKGHKLGS